MRLGYLVALLTAGFVAGCATRPLPPPPPSRPPPPATRPAPGPAPVTRSPIAPTAPAPSPTQALAPPTAFDDLPGWEREDHAAALDAFLVGCAAAQTPPVLDVCRRARSLGHAGEADARRFFETNFTLAPARDAGLLTGYFMPVYEARRQPDGEFGAPLRPRPADLPRGATEGDYPDRGAIDARPADDALAWMRPEDLFFLQIQGSGVLIFPGEAAQRAVFDGSNGAPFLGLAAPMRARGLLADGDSSAEAIRGWLVAHRGPEAQALMRLDRRYVFFRLQPDDGGEPAGAAGVRLIPGRTVAVDPSRHDPGELLWLDASSPALAGAFPIYRRLAVALDTGGAIKGEARADLYLGRGPEAGLEAGRVRHILRLYRLTPIEQPGS